MKNLLEQKKHVYTARALRCVMNRRFSTEWVPPPHPTQFRSPKVRELYFSLTALSQEDLSHLASYTLKQVGIDVEKEREKQAAWMNSPAAIEPAIVEAAPEEVKTSFDLKLISFDAAAKIKIIKEVRAITELGLKEAKDLVEGVPKLIKKGIKLEEAEALRAKLTEVGAELEII
jgi:large subunit ribosomal protein L7/L12